MDIEYCDYLENIQEKKEYTVQRMKYPKPISKTELDAIGLETKEMYKIDIANKSIALKLKVTLQNRLRTNIHLLRLDIGGGPHRNPDGRKIIERHLHVYHQGFGDAFAYPLNDPSLHKLNPSFDFSRLNNKDPKLLFEAFNDLCNFVKPIVIEDSFA